MADPQPRSTLDPAEIEKFSALARQWWDPSGPFGALHRMNPVRLGFLRERAMRHFLPRRAGEVSAAQRTTKGAQPGAGARHRPLSQPAAQPDGSPASGGANRQPLAGLTVLDIGCGGGLISAPLARLGGKVTGADASEEAIGAAQAHASEAGLDIDFRVATAEALAADGRRFDLVVAMEIVEHVADVAMFLGAASTLVKPGGMIALSTINRTPKARALAIVGAERILRWAPEGAHDYDKLVRPEEIRAATPDIAWEEPVGMVFNPLGSGWTLSNDTDVNYLMAGAKGKP